MELVGTCHLGVLVLVRKTLLLNPSHVHDVRGGEARVQVRCLRHVTPARAKVLDDLGGHPEQFWTGEHDSATKPNQCVREGVHRSAVAKVPCEHDIEAIESTVRLADGEQVEHGLCGVVPSPVASVQHRDAGGVLRVPGRALARVTQRDDVRVPVDHLNGVKQGFAFHHRGRADVTKVDDVPTQSLHGGFKRHPCPRARLEKQVAQDSTLQEREVGLTPSHRQQTFGCVEHLNDVFVAQVLHRDETDHG